MEVPLMIGFLILVAVLALASKGSASPIQPASGLDAMIHAAARRHGQDPILMKAIIRVESNFNPSAVNPADPSYGLAQIMPFWVGYFGLPHGGDASTYLLNAENNLEVQARILNYFQTRGFRFPDQVDIYNVGETLWARGVRNARYRDDVLRFYREYGGIE